MTAAAFLTIVGVHLLAAMSPGPSFVVAVRLAVVEGFRPAAAMAVGLGLGALVWAGAAMGGVALLFELAPAALSVLKLAGAAYLAWLAVAMWRHADGPMPAGDAVPAWHPLAALRLGVTTQLANPKPAVFFGAVFVGLIPPDTGTLALALLLGVIFVNETLWYIVVARVLSAPRMRVAYGRAKGAVDRIFGGLLGALAGRLAIG